MILQFLQGIHRAQVVELLDQQVLPIHFELIPVGQDHVEALQGHLDGLVVLHAEQVDVVADDAGLAVEGEDDFWLA